MSDPRATPTHVHYRRTGSGPSVLLLQGVGLAGRAWRPQIDALSGEFTLVSTDNRGVGSNPLGDPAALTIDAMATDAIGAMDAAGIDRFHVVGHSMGGVIAQAVALSCPTRVLSLSLLCTFRRGRDATAVTPTMLWLGVRTRIGTRAMRRRAFVEMVMPSSYLETRDRNRVAAELADVFGRDLADQPAAVMRQLGALSRYDAGSRLAELAAIRTMVMSAEHDVIARPDSGRALAEAIPGATFILMPDAGHAVPIQDAPAVNELLAGHFRSGAR